MNILFTGRKAFLDRSLKAFAEDKLGKLERVVDEVLEAHVILKVEKHRHQAEILLKTRTNTLAARAEAVTFREAIADCVDRLLAQARKRNARFKQRRRRLPTGASTRRGAAALALHPGPGEPARDERPRVIRMGRIPAKPMSLDEALLQVRGSRDPFLVFLNAESQQFAVLFRRSDGRYGLVEAEP
ncbi:MAG: ribosome hibernation-promoting factor, HPF/YfiA family [Acidobacteriota bacterium]